MPGTTFIKKVKLTGTLLALLGRGFFGMLYVAVPVALCIGALMAREYAAAFVAGVVALLLGFFIYMRIMLLKWDVQAGMRKELRRLNCCPQCGYDLRGSALRCPECGAAMRSANIEI